MLTVELGAPPDGAGDLLVDGAGDLQVGGGGDFLIGGGDDFLVDWGGGDGSDSGGGDFFAGDFLVVGGGDCFLVDAGGDCGDFPVGWLLLAFVADTGCDFDALDAIEQLPALIGDLLVPSSFHLALVRHESKH